MKEKNRNTWVNIAMQYDMQNTVYRKTRCLADPIKWMIRCIMTIIEIIFVFPFYFCRMLRLKHNNDVLNIKAKQYGKELKVFLPEIYISGLSVSGDYIQMMIFTRRKLYESSVLEYLHQNIIIPEMSIIDVGANIGNHTLFFAEVCEAGMVWCFEPIKSIYATLVRNIELNSLENVKTFNMALGHQDSFCSVKKFSSTNLGGTQLQYDPLKGLIEVRQLDSFNFAELDFLKIDVEGMEYSVLMGGKETISKLKPIILVEIWPENFSKTNDLLVSWGYMIEKQFDADNYLYKCNR